MDRKFNSIVDELLDYVPTRSKELFVESRGQQLIASAVHLKRLISESFDAATATDLNRRLVRAIESGDSEKFSRRLRSIRESNTRTSRKPRNG